MNQTILSESDQRWRNEIITQLAKEARIPIQRAMMTEWNQIEANKYRTRQGREVELSNMLVVAIDRLPCSGRYVFSLSPFPPTIRTNGWIRRENSSKRSTSWRFLRDE